MDFFHPGETERLPWGFTGSIACCDPGEAILRALLPVSWSPQAGGLG